MRYDGGDAGRSGGRRTRRLKIKLPRPLTLGLAKMALVYFLRTGKPGFPVPAWIVWVVTRRPGPGEAPEAGSDTLIAQDNLVAWNQSPGRTGEAIAIEERVAAARERVLGPEHPDHPVQPGTVTARGNLAAQYQSAGRTDEAIAIEERVAAARERVLHLDQTRTQPGTPARPVTSGTELAPARRVKPGHKWTAPAAGRIVDDLAPWHLDCDRHSEPGL